MNRQRLQHNWGNGFTLIEIIVSMSIVAFVLAVALAAQVTANKAKEKLVALSDLASELRYATEYVRRDLANVFRGNIKEDKIIEGKFELVNERESSRLIIKTVNFQPIRSGYPESGLCEHEYYLEQDEQSSVLMRRRQPNTHAVGKDGGIVEPIAENIVSFMVMYKADESSESMQEWPPENSTAMPYKIEVILSAKNPEYSQVLLSSFTMEFPRMTGGSR